MLRVFSFILGFSHSRNRKQKKKTKKMKKNSKISKKEFHSNLQDAKSISNELKQEELRKDDNANKTKNITGYKQKKTLLLCYVHAFFSHSPIFFIRIKQ